MKNKILLVEDELDMSLIVADTLCAEEAMMSLRLPTELRV